MSGLPDAAAEGSRQVRVLIVEDEPLVAADLQTILVDAGFQISGVATRLSKALSLIETVALRCRNFRRQSLWFKCRPRCRRAGGARTAFYRALGVYSRSTSEFPVGVLFRSHIELER
jgi:hypothetical protein